MESGYQIYSEEMVESMKKIQQMKKGRFSLNEIKKIALIFSSILAKILVYEITQQLPLSLLLPSSVACFAVVEET